MHTGMRVRSPFSRAQPYSSCRRAFSQAGASSFWERKGGGGGESEGVLHLLGDADQEPLRLPRAEPRGGEGVAQGAGTGFRRTASADPATAGRAVPGPFPRPRLRGLRRASPFFPGQAIQQTAHNVGRFRCSPFLPCAAWRCSRAHPDARRSAHIQNLHES